MREGGKAGEKRGCESGQGVQGRTSGRMRGYTFLLIPTGAYMYEHN